MIAPISRAFSQALSRPNRRPASVTKAGTGWFFFPVPDLSSETKKAITKAAAWPAFMAILSALHHVGRTGTTEAKKAAKVDQKVGVGLRALARDIGASVGTIRRQARRLADLGLVVMHEPGCLHVADPATGKITAKRNGRAAEVAVILTITEAHMRPTKKAKRQGGDGFNLNPSAADSKVQSEPTFREEKKQRTPGGDACGISTPPALRAGGLSAGKAGHEGGCGYQDRFLWTQRRLEAEKARLEAEDAALRAERPPADADAPSTPQKAPPAIPEPVGASGPDADAEALMAIIRRRQAEDAANAKAERQAKRDRFKALAGKAVA